MKRLALLLAAVLCVGYAGFLHHVDAPRRAPKIELCPAGQRVVWVDSGRDENGVMQFVYMCDKGTK